MSLSVPQERPRLFSDDLDVLAFSGQRLLDGPAPARPRFGDDVWDFAALAAIPAYRRIPAATRVDFGLIAAPHWRRCAKEVAIALLQPTVGLEQRLPRARRSPVPPQDLVRHLTMWRGWFAWLAAHDVQRLAEVTQAHCDAWLAGRRVEVQRSAAQADVIAVRRFADYGPILSADAYRDGFRPWGDATASQVVGTHPHQENRTPVIPDEIFGPLLAGALFLVRVAGPDVLAAQAEWDRLQRRRSNAAAMDANLRRYLARLRREGRRLPGLHQRHLDHQRGRDVLDEADPLHRVNLKLIEAHVGAYPGSLRRRGRRQLVERALAELGCGDGGLLTVPASVADPAEPEAARPWHPGFSPFDLEDMASLVVTAGYLVVAALSGLRHSELAEMRRGCVRPEQLTGGKVRWRIETRLIKGRPFGGELERWTVIEEVVQAFAMVEQLVDRDMPFARRTSSARYPRLVRWVNTEGRRAFLTPIPDGWRLSDRQFRRTLARLLGFRPHGVLAGKVHLKHVSVATSEGYYGRPGSSAAAFLADVERERARARVENTTRLYQEWAAGSPMTGPGRAELAGLFASVRQDLAAQSGVVVASERRVEDLLRRRAETLHVGPLNHCWFVDPSRARCLQVAGRTDAVAPLIALCEPTSCVNSTIHPEHVPIWLDTRRGIDRLLADGRVPAQEKQRLEPERARVQRVIDTAGGAR